MNKFDKISVIRVDSTQNLIKPPKIDGNLVNNAN